jgi:hypothetical protein
MDKKKISHKELLTFSNVINLQWEYVDLEAIKNDEHQVGGQAEGESLSTQLNDLLSNPEVFAKKDQDGDIVKYSYIPDIKDETEVTKNDIEQGLAQMRKEAGIAMEYLEKDEAGSQFKVYSG